MFRNAYPAPVFFVPIRPPPMTVPSLVLPNSSPCPSVIINDAKGVYSEKQKLHNEGPVGGGGEAGMFSCLATGAVMCVCGGVFWGFGDFPPQRRPPKIQPVYKRNKQAVCERERQDQSSESQGTPRPMVMLRHAERLRRGDETQSRRNQTLAKRGMAI